MAVTSVIRDKNASDVWRLHDAGLSQRQIAERLRISRPMVQRILSVDDPIQYAASGDVAEFRAELLTALDQADGDLVFLRRLEAAEARFNAEYGLTGRGMVKAAQLRRMMAEGYVHGR
jgi:transcriptional regulator with XRE-family HTH domain